MNFIKRGLSFCLALSAFIPSIAAQSKTALPSKEEAKALLDKAFDQTNLRADGAPPFHIRVRVKSYGPKGEAIDGTYELWWAAENRWHQEVSWGGPPIVTVASNSHFSVLGNDTYLRDTLRIENVLKFWPTFYTPNQKAILQIKSGDLDGAHLACVRDYALPAPGANLHIAASVTLTPRNVLPDQTICFDPATGAPVEIESGDSRWLYGEYADMGPKRFPREIHELADKKPLIDAHVELLEPFDKSHFETFIPPVGAVSRNWCFDMTAPTPVYFGGPPRDLAEQDRERHNVAPRFPAGYEDLGLIVFSVDESGHTTDVRAFLPGGQRGMKDSQKHLLMQSTFKPASCGATPVKDDYMLWQ